MYLSIFICVCILRPVPRVAGINKRRIKKKRLSAIVLTRYTTSNWLSRAFHTRAQSPFCVRLLKKGKWNNHPLERGVNASERQADAYKGYEMLFIWPTGADKTRRPECIMISSLPVHQCASASAQIPRGCGTNARARSLPGSVRVRRRVCHGESEKIWPRVLHISEYIFGRHESAASYANRV